MNRSYDTNLEEDGVTELEKEAKRLVHESTLVDQRIPHESMRDEPMIAFSRMIYE